MNKKWLPYVLILALAIAVFVIKRYRSSNDPASKSNTSNPNNRSSNTTNCDRGFDRRISYIQYSNHAKCRMQCRKISQAEVEEIMQEGKINYNKSDIKNARCPRYALEGVTKDEQRVRIVYAQCNEATTVVTVIDLDTDFECHCPGDDDGPGSPAKNRN